MWEIALDVLYSFKERFKLVTQQPIFRKFWHAVMPLTDLALGPEPFTLLGVEIVLFLDASGHPAALRDRGCHRTAATAMPGWRSKTRWPASPRFRNLTTPPTAPSSSSPKPSKYELVENEAGFYAETVIDATNPEKFHSISGVKPPITTRHMRNAYFLPFSRRLDIEYPADILESTDPDALVDLRRRGVEYSMDSDRPGILIRKKLLELLVKYGEQEVHRGSVLMQKS